MRLIDMPGARILRMVTIISTAATSAAISVNVTICAQTSTRLPGAYSGPDSGTYANHPVSGPVLEYIPANSSSPPNRNVQYPKAFSRGYANSRVPTISGTRYVANAVITGTAKRNIIAEPCVVNSWL